MNNKANILEKIIYMETIVITLHISALFCKSEYAILCET
jgi:hypothetical protein